jgi:hypothetical protein
MLKERLNDTQLPLTQTTDPDPNNDHQQVPATLPGGTPLMSLSDMKIQVVPSKASRKNKMAINFLLVLIVFYHI